MLNNTSLLFLISIFIYFLISTICLPFKYLLYSEKFNKSFMEELERFKEMNIKVVDGEAIFIPDYDLLYFWDGEKLRPLPTTTLRASYEG